jgi:signal transducing adaptor molecule
LPEPTAAELAKEAEQEAAVFAQAVNVDKLLTMLRGLDPVKDNLADNEEIQVCTEYCVSLEDEMK